MDEKEFCHCLPSGCVCPEALCVPTAIKETKEALVNLNNTLKELKESTSRLNTSLSDVRRNVEQSLGDPMCAVPPVATTCNNIRVSLGQLDDNTDLGQVRRRPCYRAVSLGHLSGARWPGVSVGLPWGSDHPIGAAAARENE